MEWLTVPDAARHLSIVFGEVVSEADVLRLALDARLRLSVYFVNHATARRGKTVPLSEAKKVPGIPLDKDGKPCEPYEVILGLRMLIKHPDGQVENKVVQFDGKIVSIEGVWDLSMLGGERLDVEHKYQMLTNGVEVTLVNIDGSYVWGLDGELWELQNSFEDIEFYAGSIAQLEKLKLHIAVNNIGAAEAEKLLNRHKEDRKEFLEQKKSRPASESYYPAGGLPDDSVLVVRTDALRKFEESINSPPASAEKPMTTTERNTLLTIIAALCDYSAIVPAERGAASQIVKMSEEIGAPVSDDTIRNVLAKIPVALESRKK